MTDNKLNNSLTKLRFIDENGEMFPDWEEKKLGEIGKTYNGLSGKAGGDFSEKPQQGYFPYVSYVDVYSQNTTPESSNYVKINENDKNNIVQKGDIFFTTSSETKSETGLASLMIFTPSVNTYLNSFCFGFRYKNNCNSVFLMNVMRYGELRKKINVLAQGSTRYNISKIKLMEESVTLPTLAEQTKIANLLSKIDERIEAQAKLVELLKKQKQGYSQKIFNGSLRFKKDDGTDYGDWEEKKLGEVGEIITGSTPSKNNDKYWTNVKYNWYSPTDFISKEVNFSKDLISEEAWRKVRKIPSKSIMVTCIGSIGKIAMNKEEASTNQQINTIIPNDSYVNEIIYYAIENNIEYFIRLKSSNVIPIINKTTMSNFSINLPSLPEQEKIAEFLSSLDNRIEKQGKVLEKLKKQKNGYMQKVLG